MREFMDAWWHADDYVTAAELLSEAIAPWGAAPTTGEELSEAMAAFAGVDDEDAEEDLRRHQIGWAARRANAALAAAGREERVRAFGDGADSESSAWRVCLPGEVADALEELGAPDVLEAAWDDAGVVDPIAEVLRKPRVRRIDSLNALRVGEEAYRKRDYALALRAGEVLVESGDMLRGALLSMDALVGAGRHDDARTLWLRVAARWLEGFTYPVLRHQWDRLLALEERLEPLDDALVARCREKQDQAPRL